MGRIAAAALAALWLGAAPTAGADPVDPAGVEPAPAGAEASPAVAEACGQFRAALDLAARSYDEFAYASAGNGDLVDYADQRVWRSNVVGRTALRETARTALAASRTPGLPDEVSDPMRTWSLHATKLLVIMGMRGGGDRLNAAAEVLNTDARAAQMACARHGGQA